MEDPLETVRVSDYEIGIEFKECLKRAEEIMSGKRSIDWEAVENFLREHVYFDYDDIEE